MKKAEKQSFIDVMESFTESYLPLEKGCVQNTIKSYKTSVSPSTYPKQIASKMLSLIVIVYLLTTENHHRHWLRNRPRHGFCRQAAHHRGFSEDCSDRRRYPYYRWN